MFSDELNDLIINQLKVAAPDMEPPSFSEIPDVDEYEFVEIEAQVNGGLGELINLLRVMDKRGLLIKTFKLSKAYTRHQSDLVEMDFTVARLVKRPKSAAGRSHYGRRTN